MLFLLIILLLPSPKAWAQKIGVTLRSKNKELSLLEEKIRIAGVGDRFSIKKGVNRFEVRASGFLTRELIIIYGPRAPKEVEVNLLKPLKKQKLSLPSFAGKAFPVPSICKTFPNHCQRQNLLEDAIFAGLFHLPHEGRNQLGSDASLLNLPPGSQEQQAKSQRLAKLELAIAKAPQSKDLYIALATQALTGGHCLRVARLLFEAYYTGADHPHLFLAGGLCLEALRRPQAVPALYRQLGKDQKAPALAYHLATIGLKLKNLGMAQKAIDECRQTAPHYYPCQELEFMLRQNTNAKTTSKAFRMTEKTPMKSFFASAESLSMDRIIKERFTKISHFEWLAALLLRNQSPIYQVQIPYTLPAHLPTSIKMLKALETKLPLPTLLTAYQTLAIAASPSPYLWDRYLGKLASHDLCEQVVATTQLAKKHQSPITTAMLTKKASCLLKLKRYGDAIALYKSLINSKSEWRDHYNLAVALDAARKKAPAREAYQKALSHSPPNPYKSRMEERVKELTPKKSSLPEP